MSCPFVKPRYEPIADEFIDHDLILYPHHNTFTHLGCVLLRTSLGIMLISPNLTEMTQRKISLIIICAILLFGFKYFTKVIWQNTTYWKSYLRMLVAYSTALCLINMKQAKFAGLIIISDALIGLNARHTASILSCGLQK